uniref:C3H1-type domain-containing protein n=1 Tax=Pyramimonas orientalis virus TaxID=455367 RepID=A0A7M3UPA1_POV01|nr:hypothetical protein HWQ62_00445 [Pyramimonas orientalis virus]
MAAVKTKLCKYFSKGGFCKHDSKCKFAHGTEDLLCSAFTKLSTKSVLEQKDVDHHVMSLYCSHCGHKQAWDAVDGSLVPVLDDDGSFKRSTTEMTRGCIMFSGREFSICTRCAKQVMKNPMSSVCVHCDGLQGPYWTQSIGYCVNASGVFPFGKRFLQKNPMTVATDEAGVIPTPCEYSLGSSNPKKLHGAIAGKLLNVGRPTKDGGVENGSGCCYGFVMVH